MLNDAINQLAMDRKLNIQPDSDSYSLILMIWEGGDCLKLALSMHLSQALCLTEILKGKGVSLCIL